MSTIGRLRRLRSPDERPLPARRGQPTPELAPPWPTVPLHRLTRALDEEFLVSSTVLKRYPCHATAHAAVKAVRDPESFDETALSDPQIRALCRRVRLVPKPGGGHGGMASTVTITLAHGRRFEGRAENGMLEPGELSDKFLRLTRRALGEPGAAALFERQQRLKDEADLNWLGARPQRARHDGKGSTGSGKR